jgi:hypothetical protein
LFADEESGGRNFCRFLPNLSAATVFLQSLKRVLHRDKNNLIQEAEYALFCLVCADDLNEIGIKTEQVHVSWGPMLQFCETVSEKGDL